SHRRHPHSFPTRRSSDLNALIGSHLQAQLLNYDQVNPAFLAKYGQALLTQAFDSPAAIAAGITAPYANFKNEWGSGATVGRALRSEEHTSELQSPDHLVC